MTPSEPFRRKPADADDEALRATAQEWVIRCDRGLTPVEGKDFDHWLHADPRHAAAFQRSKGVWSMLERIPAEVALAARPAPKARFRAWWTAAGAIAAAVTIAFVGWRWSRGQDETVQDTAAEIAALRAVRLSDGTAVLLSRDAEVTERFSSTERRVLLTQGEALFEVSKNPGWPFVVRAGSVEVCAVGTAFNVRLGARTVEVKVAEGLVRVASEGQHATAPTAAPVPTADAPLLQAGQQAVVDLAPARSAHSIQVSKMDTAAMAQVLARQEPLLRLGGSTLAELAAEFERRTGRRVVLADPDLASLRVGGRFRADDLEGFVWLLEGNYGLKSERTPDGSLILRRAR